jgi:hypothetical protein
MAHGISSNDISVDGPNMPVHNSAFGHETTPEHVAPYSAPVRSGRIEFPGLLDPWQRLAPRFDDCALQTSLNLNRLTYSLDSP